MIVTTTIMKIEKNVYHLLPNTPLDLAGIGPSALDVYAKIAFLIIPWFSSANTPRRSGVLQ